MTKKPRVLIISYFFYPNTTIVSTLRIHSWFVNLPLHGLEVIGLTRNWEEQPIRNIEHLLAEDHTPLHQREVNGSPVYYLPFVKSNWLRWAEKLEAYRFSRPLFLVYKLLLGVFGVFTNEADIHYAFKKEVDNLLSREKVDLVITSAMPLSALKLGAYVRRQHGIPVLVDFRDHWNNNLLNKKFKFHWRARLFFKIQERYIRKWLKPIDGVLTVSEGIRKELARVAPEVPQKIIFNGFEESLFPSIVKSSSSTCFQITILGALYPTQDIGFMLDGFNRFLQNKTPGRVKINFIGLAYFHDIAKQVEEALPVEFIKITGRIPRENALEILMDSHILYYIGWKGFEGIYSGKIFEYLGARKNILVAPSDGDVLEALLKETHAGKTADSALEMANLLEDWYREWEQNGSLNFRGKEESIMFYSRENQSKLLADYIHTFFHA